jgi:hypothetical protein
MLWKTERAVAEEFINAPSAAEGLDGTPLDEVYPTPAEVFHEVAVTLATALTLALIVTLALDALGL